MKPSHRLFIIAATLGAGLAVTAVWLNRDHTAASDASAQASPSASHPAAPASSAGPDAEVRRCALPAQAPNHPHPGMVWVPAGEFVMGDVVYDEEGPVTKTRVAGFWMDRTEVTNDEFARFVEATAYVTQPERALSAERHAGLPEAMRRPGAVVFRPPARLKGDEDVSQWWQFVPGAQWRHPGGPGTDLTGKGAFPVVAITHEDALAYARWKGRELPSEAQWERAARAGTDGPMPSHEQPAQANTWQGLFPMVNSGEDGFIGLAPVGCFAPNALGLFDMIGNVWEWTADVYRPGHDHGSKSPLSIPGSEARVIKGGSFLCAPNYCMRYRSGARQPQEHDLGVSHVGFRTVLVAPGPQSHGGGGLSP